MAAIKKLSNGKYRAQLYVKLSNGSVLRPSAVYRTKREAEAWAVATEAGIRSKNSSQRLSSMTLGDLLARYRDEVSPTKRGCRFETLRINAWLRDDYLPLDKEAQDIEPEDIAAFRDLRLTKVQAGSVLRELSLLGSVFEHGRIEWKVCKSNPTRDIRKPRAPDHREVVIPWSYVKPMLREMGYSPRGRIKTISAAIGVCWLVALRTGMREGELCGLTWDRMFDGYCKTPHKNGKTKDSLREVPLTAKAQRLIARMEGFDPKLVFGVNPKTLDAMFRKFRGRAGLSGFTFHDSRHTSATWIASRMTSKNVPAHQAVLDLCKIFGWTDMNQALTYYNPKAADIAKRIS